MAQEFDDALRLFGLGDGNYDVRQVFSLVATEKSRQFQPQAVSEVRAKILDDVGLGGRGEAGHGHPCCGEVLADEPRDIKVVGPKVVPPLGKAMSLVEHPGRNLAHSDRIGKRAASELLWRHEHDPCVAEADLVECCPPLQRREQTIEGHGAVHAGGHQVVHLILHQRLQRGDDHRELPRSPIVHEGIQQPTRARPQSVLRREVFVYVRQLGPGGKPRKPLASAHAAALQCNVFHVCQTCTLATFLAAQTALPKTVEMNSPGPKPRDYAQLDTKLAYQLRAALTAAVKASVRLELPELFTATGLWGTFRHQRHRLRSFQSGGR